MSENRVIANRYEITSMIDQGGMGDVYQALDRTTGQTVAVKALKPQVLEEDPALLERFRREAGALAKLNHPNIVRVLETVSEDERHYIIMEYVGGGSLAKLLRQTPQIPIPKALQLSLDLCDALTRTHRLNIIHRDLKPANVLLTEDGIPKLTDFGVARIGDAPTMMTQVGSILGTVSYLSPEVCEGGIYNEKSDIWAFGIMLYEMLTGRLPFKETSAVATIAAIMGDEIPDPHQFRSDLPPRLVELIARMLAKDPNARIASVRAVGAELDAILRGDKASEAAASPTVSTPPTPAASTPLTPSQSIPPVSLPPRPGDARRAARSTPKEPLIFLCYRREDTGEIAGRMHEHLIKAFGESAILRDVDRISDRTVSRLVLANDVVSHSDVMIIVIGRGWLGVKGKGRSIDNPKDPIRIQIEAALKRPEMSIIPVLVNGASMPTATDLPPSVQPILANEPLIVADNALDAHMKRLISRIKAGVGDGTAQRRIRALIALGVLIGLLVLLALLAQINGASSATPTAPATAAPSEAGFDTTTNRLVFYPGGLPSDRTVLTLG